MLTISIHHPDVLEQFIKIKRDLKKVTGANISVRVSDEFMKAVEKGTTYEQRFPVEPGLSEDQYLVKRQVDAKEIWKEIVHSAWTSAEPGVLFWDTAKKMTPAEIYEEHGFGSTATNPCLSYDTKIAVADGRGSVEIGKLAEEGRDVPVYSTDPKTGLISIKMGRHPRITGYNKNLVRVTIDNGMHFDVTPDHKFMLRDGSFVEAKNLNKGDSLSPFKKAVEKIKSDSDKSYYRVYTNTRNSNKNKIFEHRLISQFNEPEKWNSKYDLEKQNGWMKGGLVVHHKDYNSLNNAPDNLELMTFREHQQFHADHDCSGKNNGRYMGYNSDEIYQIGIKLTKSLGRRFSAKEWQSYAKQNNLPQTFSRMHHDILGKNVIEFGYKCASELKFENVESDPRLAKTLQSMIEQNYDARIKNSVVLVKKNCEVCGSEFEIKHNRKEQAFSSQKCSLDYVNNKYTKKRTESTKKHYQERAVELKEQQAKIWSELKFSLGREPLMKEWEKKCKENGLSFRLKTKFGFKNFKEVAEAGKNYNHKVVSVEVLSGKHTVYNITVDDNHTLAIVGDIEHNGHKTQVGINVLQCGEIILSPYDSCRLMLLNLFSFVRNAFTKNAYFDYELFGEMVVKAQRLMDDVVDLEIEAIGKILKKVKADPENNEIKHTEIRLWEMIREQAKKGRRTGLGITALGDTLAALGVKYGSKQSVKQTEKIYKALAINSYKSSVTLAEERGAFPIFNKELEKGHPFLERIWEAAPDVYELYKKHGRRNISNTTTAPAGSVSTQTQTTSGIEGVFLTSYTRRKKINPNDENARVDFVDALGDKWQHFTVYHHGVQKWMEATGNTNVEDSPYFGATSADIDWVASVDIQAAAQKWVCHAISKTCNLPKDIDEETVAKVYERAWKLNCKGFTIYRDGSRTGVLVQNKQDETERPNKINTVNAPKRPDSLVCDVHRMNIRGKGNKSESWICFVSMLHGKPYEIFTGLQDEIIPPKKLTQGAIIKRKTAKTKVSKYDLYFNMGQESEIIFKDITSHFKNDLYGSTARLISLSLRHGVPIHHTVEQLQKMDMEDMFSFNKVIARVLKTYIVDGTKINGKHCPQCQSKNLSYQEGCLTCMDCGYSKCG